MTTAPTPRNEVGVIYPSTYYSYRWRNNLMKWRTQNGMEPRQFNNAVKKLFRAYGHPGSYSVQNRYNFISNDNDINTYLENTSKFVRARSKNNIHEKYRTPGAEHIVVPVTTWNPELLEEGVLTQYSQEFLDEFDDPIDFGDIFDGALWINADTTVYKGRGQSGKVKESTAGSSFLTNCLASLSFLSSGDYPQEIQDQLEETISAAGITKALKLRRVSSGTGMPDQEWKELTGDQLLVGHAFFAYKMPVEVYDPRSCTWSTMEFRGIACYSPIRHYFGYKKARRWLDNAITHLYTDDGLAVINPGEYQRRIQERLENIDLLWTPQAIGQQVSEEDLLDLATAIADIDDNLKTIEQSQEYLKEEDLGGITASADALKTPVGKRFKRLEQAKNALKSKLENAKSTLESYEYDIKYYKQQQTRYKNKIKSYEADIKKFKEDIERAGDKAQRIQEKADKTQPQVVTYSASLEEFEPKYKQARGELDKKVKELIDNPESKFLNLHKAFLRSDILLLDVKYSVSNHNSISPPEASSIKTNPLIHLDPDAQMRQVKFCTIKPSKIHVDRARNVDKPDKAGGPWEVTINRSNNSIRMFLRLASPRGIIGWNGRSTAKVHPHTSGIRASTLTSAIQTLVTSTDNACLGDAAPPITKGFMSGDIRAVVMSALAFLTSANTRDGWGQFVTHFPLASDVNMDKVLIDIPELEELNNPEPTETPEDSEIPESITTAAAQAVAAAQDQDQDTPPRPTIPMTNTEAEDILRAMAGRIRQEAEDSDSPPEAPGIEYNPYPG